MARKPQERNYRGDLDILKQEIMDSMVSVKGHKMVSLCDVERAFKNAYRRDEIWKLRSKKS